MASIWNDYYTDEELERYKQMNAPQIFDMNQPLPPTDLKYSGAVNAEMIPGENLLYQQARKAGIPEEAIMLGGTVLSKRPVKPSGPKKIGGPELKKVDGVRVDQMPGTKVNKPIVQTVNMPKRNIFQGAADYIRKNPKKSLFTAASTVGAPYLASNIQDSNVVNNIADSIYGKDNGASEQNRKDVENVVKKQPSLWQSIQNPDWWMSPIEGGAGGWDNRLFRLGEMMEYMGTPLANRKDSPAKRWQLAQKNAMDAAKAKVKKPPAPLAPTDLSKYIEDNLKQYTGMFRSDEDVHAKMINQIVRDEIRSRQGDGRQLNIQAITDKVIEKYVKDNNLSGTFF